MRGCNFILILGDTMLFFGVHEFVSDRGIQFCELFWGSLFVSGNSNFGHP